MKLRAVWMPTGEPPGAFPGALPGALAMRGVPTPAVPLGAGATGRGPVRSVPVTLGPALGAAGEAGPPGRVRGPTCGSGAIMESCRGLRRASWPCEGGISAAQRSRRRGWGEMCPALSLRPTGGYAPDGTGDAGSRKDSGGITLRGLPGVVGPSGGWASRPVGIAGVLHVRTSRAEAARLEAPGAG